VNDTPRTNFVAHESGDHEWNRSINRFGRMFAHACILERELAEARTQPRERLAQWMIAHSIATGHGDTLDDLLLALDAHVAEARADLARVTAERDTALVARDFAKGEGYFFKIEAERMMRDGYAPPGKILCDASRSYRVAFSGIYEPCDEPSNTPLYRAAPNASPQPDGDSK